MYRTCCMSLLTKSGLSHIAKLVLKSAKLSHENSFGLWVSLTLKGVAEAIGTFAKSAHYVRATAVGGVHSLRSRVTRYRSDHL